MTIVNPYVSMGGSVDAISYPLADDETIDKNEDVDDAIAYANEALAAAEKLQDMSTMQGKNDVLGQKLLNVAVENYISRFKIPFAALEDIDTHSAATNDATLDDPVQASRLKKVILYLYAIVQRIFKAVFDLFRRHKLTARKLIPLIKQYIGEADSLSASIANQLTIKDSSLMADLHVNGKAPKSPDALFNALAITFEKQHQFNGVMEVIQLVEAVKKGNNELILKEAQVLRAALEHGFQASLKSVDPESLAVFSEKKSSNSDYYASAPMFGQTYILGSIGKNVNAEGIFRYNCSMRRDSGVTLRTTFFPVLTPDQIRQICRTSLKVSENIIRFSRDEELLQKALRQAAFLTTKTPDKTTVTALRNIVAVGQNSYIVHLRYTTRTMQSLLRWCAVSIKRYEGVKNG